MPLSTLAQSEKGKKAILFIEGYAVAFALALGGAVAGYALSEYRLNSILNQLIADHQAEAQRLQDTNVRILSALTSRVQTAAQKVDEAGAKVANAADQSAQAAETAKSAASVMRTARPVIIAPNPSQLIITRNSRGTAAPDAASATVPESARANLNNAIERTNRKLLEHK